MVGDDDDDDEDEDEDEEEEDNTIPCGSQTWQWQITPFQMIFALYKIAIYGCFPIAMLVYQGILPSQKFGVTLSPEIDDNRVVQS